MRCKRVEYSGDMIRCIGAEDQYKVLEEYAADAQPASMEFL